MKEIPIGSILAQRRRSLGVTQDELAEYAGVSKASVSKWETGMTYPDILLLPKLASFFHMSIDELLGYRPGLSREEIRALCRELAQGFARLPFQEALERCRRTVKEHLSCPELLFQAGSLLVNHSMLAGSAEKTLPVLEEALGLFGQVQDQSRDPALSMQAVNMRAFCLLQLGRPQEVLELLGRGSPLRMAPEALLSEAHRLTGNGLEARRVLQVGIYQLTVELMNLLTAYLPDEKSFPETLRRTLALAKAFHLETLHPSLLLNVYMAAAQCRALRGERGEALSLLERYVRLAGSLPAPLRLGGDEYFDLVDGWIEENLTLGAQLPLDETLVQARLREALSLNPAFDSLREDPRFQELLRQLSSGAKERSDP